MPRFKQLSAFIIILAIGATFIWLVNGSSNRAREKGWTQGWREVASFQLPRRAPAAASYHGYLYIVGGIGGDGHYVRTVEYAPIRADGSLGQWHKTSAINQGRFYNAAEAHNGFLYTLGGGTGATGEQNYPIASVERAKINTDGSLGPWQTVSHLTTPRRGLKTVLHGDTIYAIGGYNGRFLKSTERATLKKDGTLSEWQMEVNESHIDRYIHSAAAKGDVIYLLGGHMRNPNSPSYSDVESSRIQAGGGLTPWQTEQYGLLTSRLVAEAFTLGDYLYIAGGHTGAARLTSVEVTPIDRNGRLGQWRYTTPLPVARSAYAAATADNHVYLLGGGGDGSPLNSVVMADADPRGELGYPTQETKQ
jgi:N-acetylneuraminic acid mutarotase